MTLGQAINLSREPREATPQEAMIWKTFLKDYDRLTARAEAVLSTVQVAAEFQTWLNQKKIPYRCWEPFDQSWMDAFLQRHAIIGRLIAGCDLRRYWASFEKGDIEIVAPPHMPKEQYQADVYPGAINPEVGLGIAPLVIVGLVGVSLIVGAIITTKTLDYLAKEKDDQFRKKVLNTDIEMLKQPKDIREAWARMKQSSSTLIKEANDQHGGSWFDKLLPGGIGGIAGAGLVILGLLIAYNVTRK